MAAEIIPFPSSHTNPVGRPVITEDVLRAILKLARTMERRHDRITEAMLRLERRKCVDILEQAGFACGDVTRGR